MKIKLLVAALVMAVLVTAGIVYAAGLRAPNNGKGTVDLPVPNSDYLGRFHAQFPGVDIWARHFEFRNIKRTEEKGPLGGPVETFDSTIELQLKGERGSRNIQIPASCVVHAGPINAGEKVQEFNTELHSLQANLTGDSDFESLEIVAGSANGLPSPGKTTLVDQGDGTFSVDSSFDVSYRITFKGAKGGSFEGQEGTVEDKVTMTAYPGGETRE